jgi:glycine/sarcosine N-methyltransferase
MGEEKLLNHLLYRRTNLETGVRLFLFYNADFVIIISAGADITKADITKAGKTEALMSFYEQIGKYYDHIFPVGEQQLNFIKQTAGSPPKKILDVACGSGGYSVALAREGYLLQAIDLDDEMVRLAGEKAKKEKLDMGVSKCDMKDIEGRFKMEFDGVFCIGNSIVHLGSLSEITDVFKQMNSVLRQGGFLILQTINYDRVLKYGISALPAQLKVPYFSYVCSLYSFTDLFTTILLQTAFIANSIYTEYIYMGTVLLDHNMKRVVNILGVKEKSIGTNIAK